MGFSNPASGLATKSRRKHSCAHAERVGQAFVGKGSTAAARCSEVPKLMNTHSIAPPIQGNQDRPIQADMLNAEAAPSEISAAIPMIRLSVQTVLILLGIIPFLYFARPVLIPICLACVAAMTLKPLIRWLAYYCQIPPAVSAALVISLLIGGLIFGFVQFGKPALTWVKDAPQHMTELRQRVQKYLPPGSRFSEAAASLNNLGATEEEKKAEQKLTPTVQVKDNHSSTSLINWTGSLLMGLGEMLVLLYLLLASGDMFLQKLVHVMPTLSDKKRAVEISHEIQQNISNYLFSVSLINLGLGIVVSIGLYWLGVPNALLWGILVAALNLVPYFGPVAGAILLAVVGILTFDTLGKGLLPLAWYLVLHLLEGNLITPMLLGRRFTLNPVVIFVSLICWTVLWGVPGALLSVPILVSIKVICDRVPAMSAVSELLSQ
jgi:predicted PurR-regulated permease PerM